MKKLIVSIFVCLIMYFTGGCMGITPNDIFMELVYTLDTPKKSAEWLQNNVEYKAHYFRKLTPFQVYNGKLADCDDCSGFITYIANIHGYDTWEIHIFYSDIFSTHMIGIYQEDRLSYTDNWLYFYGFDTFREIVIDDDKCNEYNWEAYRVYDSEGNIIERGVRQ